MPRFQKKPHPVKQLRGAESDMGIRARVNRNSAKVNTKYDFISVMAQACVKIYQNYYGWCETNEQKIGCSSQKYDSNSNKGVDEEKSKSNSMKKVAIM